MTETNDQAGTGSSTPVQDQPDPAPTATAINATWRCPGCLEEFAGTPPEHYLCGDCLNELELAGYQPAPGAPYDDLPPCQDCGGQLVEVVRVDDMI